MEFAFVFCGYENQASGRNDGTISRHHHAGAGDVFGSSGWSFAQRNLPLDRAGVEIVGGELRPGRFDDGGLQIVSRPIFGWGGGRTVCRRWRRFGQLGWLKFAGRKIRIVEINHQVGHVERAEIRKTGHLLDAVFDHGSDQVFAEILGRIDQRRNRWWRALAVHPMATLAI